MMSPVVIAVTAFVLATFLTYRFSRPGSGFYLLDHPNERSLHTSPTPRSGGVAIVIAIGLASLIWFYWHGAPAVVYGLAAGIAVVAGMSYLDDWHGLPVLGRLLGHAIGASLLLVSGLSLHSLSLPGIEGSSLPWVGWVFSLLFLVWMTNLYNFMDGMDGFAGGMAVFGFGTFAILGLMAGQLSFAGLCLAAAASAAGFLVFNFPPARIFMGDTGSATLGLLAGGLSLWGSREGIFPFWIALLVFSPFIVDASVTLVQRLLRSERVWQAHKTHYYQRLVQSGWGHRRTVLAEYALMLACSFSALAARNADPMWQWLVIGGWALIYMLLMRGVSLLEQKRTGRTA